MKTKYFISLLSFLLVAIISHGQDSARSRNDKPGTPQSLRTVNSAPKNKVHLIENNKPAQHSINHGAMESNSINNIRKEVKVYPGINDSGKISATPAVTIDNHSTLQTIHRDSAVNKGTMGNGQSNATNPIRK